MTKIKTTVAMVTILLVMMVSPIEATVNDRVNIGSICNITNEDEFRIKKYDLDYVCNWIYAEINPKIKACKKGSGKYVFDDNNKLWIRAKAPFPKGTLKSLIPLRNIGFLDLFRVIEINNGSLVIKKKASGEKFTINSADFHKAFIWYSSLLDKDRAYIPVYGFLSIPVSAKTPVIFYDSWKNNNIKTNYTTAWKHYDFYKILDYQKKSNEKSGRFLIGDPIPSFKVDCNKDNCGIIGWVEEDYVVLWRSRRYFHPKDKRVEYYDIDDEDQPGQRYKNTEFINKFFVEYAYENNLWLKQKLKNITFSNIRKYYRHFGFPQVYPPFRSQGDSVKVSIIGAYPLKIIKEVYNQAKKEMNFIFLIDNSISMKKFKDIISNICINFMDEEYHYRNKEYYIYQDVWNVEKCSDMAQYSNSELVIKNTSVEKITYNQTGKDCDYAEPLMRAVNFVLSKVQEMKIPSDLIKIIFIITDAGANDASEKDIINFIDNVNNQKINILLLIPSEHGAEDYDDMVDTAKKAYEKLQDQITEYEANSTRFRHYTFSASNIQEQSDELIKELKKIINEDIETSIEWVLQGGSKSPPLLNLLDPSTAKKVVDITTGMMDDLQITNQEKKYIKHIQNEELWEARIAISHQLLQEYRNRISGMDGEVSLGDLKRLIIINSLIPIEDVPKTQNGNSIDRVAVSLAAYSKLNKILGETLESNIDGNFFSALTGRNDVVVKWREKISIKKIDYFLAKRHFYLNTVETRPSNKYIYLLESDLFIKED